MKFLTRRGKYDHLRQIKDGRLRFTPLSVYRARELREDQQRFDEFEGATKIDQPRSVMRLTLTFRDPQTGAAIGPIDHQLAGPIKWFDPDGFSHVLCFSIHEHMLLREENIIDLTTEADGLGTSALLVHDIEAFVRHVGEFMHSRNIAFECRAVVYVSSDYDGQYGAFRKPERFRHQREYRLAIRIDEPDLVEFTVSRVEETLEVFNGLKIRFEAEEASS